MSAATAPAAAPAGKTYVGVRKTSGATVSVIEAGASRPLDPRFDLRNHSPDGFEWGYGGSGPAQLALALLCDALGDDERAQRLYQHFKFRVVGRMRESWTMTAAQVRAAVEEIERDDAEGGAAHG